MSSGSLYTGEGRLDKVYSPLEYPVGICGMVKETASRKGLFEARLGTEIPRRKRPVFVDIANNECMVKALALGNAARDNQ